MAWTEQCRVAFQVSAEGRLAKQGKEKNLSRIFKELSEESGIPPKTLSRWWYEREEKQKRFKADLLKIEQMEQGIEVTEESEEKPANSANEIPICTKCSVNKVYIDARKGSPYSRAAKAYGLCSPCKGKFFRQKKRERCVCTVCGHGHRRRDEP